MPDAAAEIRRIAGLEVIVEGDGDRTVVMIHGWPDTAELWAPQVAALRQQARCVRFTLPGFDRNRRRIHGIDEIVATLKQIVDAVSPHQPVTLLLHDWGCVFGYRFAQAHPARVEAIVAVDVGDAGSHAHMAGLGLRAKLGMAAYQLCLASAWSLPVSWGDALTRRIARWAGAPGDVQKIGAHMNYPYVVLWTRGYGRRPFDDERNTLHRRFIQLVVVVPMADHDDPCCTPRIDDLRRQVQPVGVDSRKQHVVPAVRQRFADAADQAEEEGPLFSRHRIDAAVKSRGDASPYTTADRFKRSPAARGLSARGPSGRPWATLTSDALPTGCHARRRSSGEKLECPQGLDYGANPSAATATAASGNVKQIAAPP